LTAAAKRTRSALHSAVFRSMYWSPGSGSSARPLHCRIPLSAAWDYRFPVAYGFRQACPAPDRAVARLMGGSWSGLLAGCPGRAFSRATPSGPAIRRPRHGSFQIARRPVPAPPGWSSLADDHRPGQSGHLPALAVVCGRPAGRSDVARPRDDAHDHPAAQKRREEVLRSAPSPTEVHLPLRSARAPGDAAG
jgi:hypothetical protein